MVGTALNAADGCDLCQQFAPQVLITNKATADENGDSLIQQIQHISPATHVIILGDFYELETILEALNAGARGYILKQTTTLDGIFKAINAVVMGTWVFCQEVYDLLPDKTSYQPYLITNCGSQ